MDTFQKTQEVSKSWWILQCYYVQVMGRFLLLYLIIWFHTYAHTNCCWLKVGSLIRSIK